MGILNVILVPSLGMELINTRPFMYCILSFINNKPIPDSLFRFFSTSLMSNPLPLSSMIMLKIDSLCDNCKTISVEFSVFYGVVYGFLAESVNIDFD